MFDGPFDFPYRPEPPQGPDASRAIRHALLASAALIGTLLAAGLLGIWLPHGSVRSDQDTALFRAEQL